MLLRLFCYCCCCCWLPGAWPQDHHHHHHHHHHHQPPPLPPCVLHKSLLLRFTDEWHLRVPVQLADALHADVETVLRPQFKEVCRGIGETEPACVDDALASLSSPR